MSIRILLVDDQPLLRHGFRLILSAQPDLDIVGEAGNGNDAVRMTEELRPHVVLMDVRMPHMDGIEATRQIVARTPSARVVILTTFDIDAYAFAALREGASGFLLKDVLPSELVSSIRVVANGQAVISPAITRRLLDTFAHKLPAHEEITESDGDVLASLTPRERDVFGELVTGRTNAEIAAELGLSEATIKSHVAHILEKLRLRDRVQAVIFAYEQGISKPAR